MNIHNRRTFVTQMLAGSVALGVIGRARAGARPDSGTATVGEQTCGGCAYYVAKPGDPAGTCAFAGREVSSGDHCGAYEPAGR